MCTSFGKCGSSIMISPEAKLNGGQVHKAVRIRASSVLPMTQRLSQAKSGKWCGWVTSVHLTETCVSEAEAIPQLIVQVHTTVASVQDVETTAIIQEDLAQHDLVPDEHVVDTGYVDADLLVSSQQKHGIRLVGPVLSDNSWQAKEGKGFDAAHFHLDWQCELATCPQGQTSHRWSKAGERIEVVFAREVCADCPVRKNCTRIPDDGSSVTCAPTSCLSRLTSAATRRAHAKISAGLSNKSRHRGDPFTSGTRDGNSPIALRRVTENASPACPNCYCD